jgi:hypothetical protein
MIRKLRFKRFDVIFVCGLSIVLGITVSACNVSSSGLDLSATNEDAEPVEVPKADAAIEDPERPALGQSCKRNDQCENGFCVQGVCCDSACNAGCVSCALKDSVGKCSPVPMGSVPKVANACPVEGETTCGFDGMCDGVGGCRRHVAGIVCGSGACRDGAETPPSSCDGKGTCVPVTSKSCAPYVCGDRACSTQCRKNDECAKGTLCIDKKCQNVDAPYVNYTLSAPTVDGSGDDDIWTRVAPQWMPVSNLIFGTVGSSDDLTSRFKGLWTPDALYVLVEVADSSLQNDNNPPQDTYKDDAIEIYFDANNSRTQTYDNVDDLQYVFGWGDDSFTEGKLNRKQNVEWAIKTSGNSRSYVLEARFPWATLGSMSPTVGKRIGFQLAVDDDDDGGDRDAQIAWFGRLADFATRPTSFGALILAGP